MILLSKKVCIAKGDLKTICKQYFIKCYPLILKGFYQALIQHIALCTIKHVGQFKRTFLKMIFVHGDCPITVLKCSVEFYKNLEIGLTWFGCNMQNL
jgi:hypothetical protein